MWESLHACCARNMDCNMEKPPECWSVGWRLVFRWFRREGLMRNCQSSSDYAFQAMHSKVPWSVPLYICVGITPDKSLSHNTSRICFQPHERFKKRQCFFISRYSDVHTPTFKGPLVYKRCTLRHLGTCSIRGTEFLLEVNFCYPVLDHSYKGYAHSPHGNDQIKRLTFNW